eukprot:g1153.t1
MSSKVSAADSYFVYESFELVHSKQRRSNESCVRFTYSLNDRLVLPVFLFLPEGCNRAAKRFGAALFSIGMVLVPWLWTIFCSRRIIVRAGHLDEEQRRFWLQLYEGALAEFFYLNRERFPKQVRLELVVSAPKGRRWKPVRLPGVEGQTRVLVPMGGGKDSLVVSELLDSIEGADWQWFFLSGTERREFEVNAQYRQIAAASGKPDVFIVDADLSAMDVAEASTGGHQFKEGAMPYMAFVAFSAALSCLLLERNYIVVGNERSANEGNGVEHDGIVVNHQWDKGFEFEQMVSTYIKTYICSDLHYFSGLMHLWDIQIAALFAKRCKRYHHLFLSCNEPDREKADDGSGPSAYSNCGKCEKCCFVFMALSAFLPPDVNIAIFGADLYEDESLISTFSALLGLKGTHKPFECVGTSKECMLAAHLAREKYRSHDHAARGEQVGQQGQQEQGQEEQEEQQEQQQDRQVRQQAQQAAEGQQPGHEREQPEAQQQQGPGQRAQPLRAPASSPPLPWFFREFSDAIAGGEEHLGLLKDHNPASGAPGWWLQPCAGGVS